MSAVHVVCISECSVPVETLVRDVHAALCTWNDAFPYERALARKKRTFLWGDVAAVRVTADRARADGRRVTIRLMDREALHRHIPLTATW